MFLMMECRKKNSTSEICNCLEFFEHILETGSVGCKSGEFFYAPRPFLTLQLITGTDLVLKDA